MLWNSLRSSSRIEWVPYVFIEDYEGASSRLGPEAVLLMSILLVRYMPKRRRQSSKEVPVAAAVLRHIHIRMLTWLQTCELSLVVTPASFHRPMVSRATWAGRPAQSTPPKVARLFPENSVIFWSVAGLHPVSWCNPNRQLDVVSQTVLVGAAGISIKVAQGAD